GNTHAATMHVADVTNQTNGFLVEAQENQLYDLDAMPSGINGLQNTTRDHELRIDGLVQNAINQQDQIDLNRQQINTDRANQAQVNADLAQGVTDITTTANLAKAAASVADNKAQAAIDGVKANVAEIDNLKTDKADLASLNNEVTQRQADVAAQATTDANQNALLSDTANEAANATTKANSATTAANNATTVANAATTSANAAQNKADVAYSAGVYAQQQAADAATVAAVNKAAVANVQSRQQAQETTIQNHSAQLKNHEERITALENESNNNFRNLKDDVDNNRKRAAIGVASVAAMSNIPQVTDSQAFAIGAGVGGYDSQGAVAIGISARITDHIVTKASVGAGSFGGATYGAGVSFGY
ncbi:TPA: YadA C-terminal domain-containing protein, partial [Enterobacter asburiae]|nr:YadA C-terminal domain-containing protein [Enterobacter asburiae]